MVSLRRYMPLLAGSGSLLGASVIWSVPAAAGDTTAPAVPAAPRAAAPVSPTAQAKSIQVQARFSIGGQNGAQTPFFVFHEQIAGPQRIRIDAMPPSGSGRDKEKPSEYLFDGRNEYEYNGIRNYYTSDPAPAAGQRSHSQLRDMTAVDIVLTGKPVFADDPGVTRTTTTETVDSRALTVTTYTQPPKPPAKGNGPATILATRIYADPATGLPVRQQELYTRGDKTIVLNQTDFSDWKLDQPIAATQFVWTVPAGAEPYEPPHVANIGKVAPDFTAYRPDGTPVKLSSLRGKIVVLDFWATWCGPCQHSMPHLEQVYRQVKDQGVAVLGVCVWDEKAEYTKWLAAKKGVYSFPTAFDPAGRGANNIAGSLYNVEGIPTQVIIDRDGKIAGGTIGYDDGDHELETALSKMGVKVTNVTESAPVATVAPAK